MQEGCVRSNNKKKTGKKSASRPPNRNTQLGDRGQPERECDATCLTRVCVSSSGPPVASEAVEIGHDVQLSKSAV